MSEKYPLSFKGANKDQVYKKAQNDNKSINTTINRLLNHALLSDKIFFEMQFIEIGDRFSFNEEKDHNFYRLIEIDLEKGCFVCQTGNKKIKNFSFDKYYNKPIFII